MTRGTRCGWLVVEVSLGVSAWVRVMLCTRATSWLRKDKLYPRLLRYDLSSLERCLKVSSEEQIRRSRRAKLNVGNWRQYHDWPLHQSHWQASILVTFFMSPSTYQTSYSIQLANFSQVLRVLIETSFTVNARYLSIVTASIKNYHCYLLIKNLLQLGAKYIFGITRIQLVVYYHCCVLIGWATSGLFVIAL